MIFLKQWLGLVLVPFAVAAVIDASGGHIAENQFEDPPKGNFAVVGKDTLQGEIPYQIEIGIERRNGSMKHICAGALISRTWLMTSAHCFDPVWHNESLIGMLTVVAGEWDLVVRHSEEQRFRIVATILHEGYNRSSRQHDIALVLLDKVVKFNDFVRPVNLPNSKSAHPSTGSAISSGWGSSGKHSVRSRILKKANVPVVPLDVCQNPFMKVTDNHICAGYLRLDPSEACEENSGGPLVCEEPFLRVPSGDGNATRKRKSGLYLCGFEAEASSCNPDGPGIYAKVSSYMEWIKNSVQRFIEAEAGIEEKPSSRVPLGLSSLVPDPTKFSFLVVPSQVEHGASEPSNQVHCSGVILTDTLVLTLRECMESFAQGIKHMMVSYKLESHGKHRWYAADVVDWFDFHPNSFLDAPVKFNYLVRGEAKQTRKRSVVLKLSQPIVFSSEAYPVNYPETKNFTGMFASMVSVKGNLDDGTSRIVTAVFEIVDIEECSKFDLIGSGLDRESVICGKQVSGPNWTKFPPGSPLMCDMSRSSKKAGQKYPMSFLCGLSLVSKEADLDSDDGIFANKQGKKNLFTVFKKFWIQGLLSDGNKLSLLKLAKLGNPFME